MGRLEHLEPMVTLGKQVSLDLLGSQVHRDKTVHRELMGKMELLEPLE